MLNQAVDLSRYKIRLTLGAIKAQALDDFFIVAGTESSHLSYSDAWNLYMDDSSTKDGSGADLIIETSRGEKHKHALMFLFKACNNEAKCKGLTTSILLCYIVGANSIRSILGFQSWSLVNSRGNMRPRIKLW